MNNEPKPPLILIVDDDRSMRTLLTMAMSEEGYEVAEAQNGEQCLAEFIRLQPDAVLLDAMMPDMDGFTCCERLRQFPGGDMIPILMITVLDDRESIERAFSVGATDYITKPIHWAVLSQRLRRLLKANRAWLNTKATAEQLQQQQAWERLFRTLLHQQCQRSSLSASLPETLTRIQNFLQVEAVALYQDRNQSWVESSLSGYPLIKEVSQSFLTLETEYLKQCKQGKTVIIEDFNRTSLPSSLIARLIEHNIQSLLIIPAIALERLWGLLYVYSDGSRQWQELELARISDLIHLLAISTSTAEGDGVPITLNH